MSDVSPLFRPTSLGPVEVSNRLAVAPMTRISADVDGCATERHARYYSRFARGGFGLVITEGLHPDHEASQGYHHQPGLADRAQARSWDPVVAAGHAAGPTRFVAQLMHAGGQSQGNRRGHAPVGPSAVAPRGSQLTFYRGQGPFPTPRALSSDEITGVRRGFVAAARHARDAGFDGVEVHGANGYLLDQFLTGYTNRRTDGYGGDVGRRVRFVAEVCDDVLQAVGDDIAVGVRISQTKVADPDHRWAGGADDAAVVFGRLTEVGVHWIHTTEPDGRQPAFADDPSTLAAHAGRASPTKVIVNGDLGAPDRALAALGRGEGDLVSLGRAALMDPAWPTRVGEGAEPTRRPLSALLQPLADVKDSELV